MLKSVIRIARDIPLLRLRVRVLVFVLLIGGVILYHLNGPVLDLALFLVGGLLTAALTILGGHVATEKQEYRVAFYVMGVALAAIIVATGVRQYQAAVAAAKAPTAEQIPMEAVDTANRHTDTSVGAGIKEANQHTDTEVSMVRDDLKQVQEHSDRQIAVVRDDLKGTAKSVSDLFSQTERNLSASISKVGKPDPPELAKLQFGFWPGVADNNIPILVEDVTPDGVGVLHVDITFKNISRVAAKAIDFWIELCSECAYAKEPEGFDRPPGMSESTRHKILQQVNPGVFYAKTSLDIKPNKVFDFYQILFRYSCETCGDSTVDRQFLTVHSINIRQTFQ